MTDPYTLDVKIIQSFNPSDYSSFLKTFKYYDKNKNGTIESNELIELLHSLGYRQLKSEDVNETLKKIDLNNNQVISFSEFLQVMKKIITSSEDNETSLITNKKGKKLVKVESRRDSSGHAYFSFTEEERAAYVKVINDALANDEVCKKYLPIDPYSNDVFDRLKDGVILCKLMNKIKEGAINEKFINIKNNMNVFQQAENLNLALSAAKGLGIITIGMNKDIFLEGNKNPSMTLGLLWQIAKQIMLQKINLKNFPELERLLEPDEQLSDLLKLSPEQLLLRWFNYHLNQASYDKPIINFSGDVKNSEKYIILLNQLDKNKCDKSGLQEPDLNKRAEKVINDAKKLGANSYINQKDIVSGNSKLNTLFVASIFNAFPGLDPIKEPPTEKEDYDSEKSIGDDKEIVKEEKALKIKSVNTQDENSEYIYINKLYKKSKTGLLSLKTLDKIGPGIVNWNVIYKECSNLFKIMKIILIILIIIFNLINRR